MRRPNSVGAVAWDPKLGVIVGWCVAQGEQPSADLAAKALRELKARPHNLRLLVGLSSAPVVRLAGAEPPGSDAIAQVMLREGHVVSRGALAHKATPDGSRAWLATALSEQDLAPFTTALAGATSSSLSVHHAQLLVCAQMQARELVMERLGEYLWTSARDEGDVPTLVRRLPWQETASALQFMRVLERRGRPPDRVRVIGESRARLRRALATVAPSVSCASEALPRMGDREVPTTLELAALLAMQDQDTPLVAEWLTRHGKQLQLARYAIALGVLVCLLGSALLFAPLSGLRQDRQVLVSLQQRALSLNTRVERIRAVKRCQGENAFLSARIAKIEGKRKDLNEALVRLTEVSPVGVAWEQLKLEKGRITLRVVAYGPKAADELGAFREALKGVSELRDLAWNGPISSSSPKALTCRQTISASTANTANAPKQNW
ncbi:MAG: hypothetical protein HN750_07790 [Gemmatimonadales bacterium]|nr:hypothetical protein [Gemmatimonadales bacterium]